ncbi:MAG TPA: isoprenylcysteine carboxylmethyltransferase family protein [Candidatus Tyrphobacter sp.]
MSVPPLYWILAIVAAQRIAEAIYAERNARALRKQGAIEYASVQHPFFVALHAGWLLAMLFFIPASTPPNWSLVAVFALVQVARLWVLATLGPRWTTRVLVLPGVPLVRGGPYRFMRHPNYAIVAIEIAVLPLAFGALWIAAVFTILNGALLGWRIRAENAALSQQ